jgi:CHAD domain-containing protein
MNYLYGSMIPDYIKLKDIKPALGAYIREAHSMIDPAVVPGETVVHDVRVLLKKSRAVMKLLKSQIDETTFNKEYMAFRKAGRMMQTWRETSVHRKVLKDLRKRHPDIFSRLQDNEKINSLLQKPDTIAVLSSETREYLEQISSMLSKSGYRIRFQSLNNLDPHILLRELELTYINVGDCYLTARNNPKASNIHEFRKKTKDFLYQLYFFRALKPKVIRDLERRLDMLTQNLGKCNDFSVLINTLGYRYTSAGNDDHSLDELVVIIRNEQDRYLSKVWPEAYRIFCPGQKLINLLGFKILVI